MPRGTHTFSEIFDSRVGSVHGATGVQDERIIRVTLDVDTEDHTNARYPDPRIAVQTSYIPPGSYSPWNAFARATYYRIIARETPKTWLIGVLYTVGEPAGSGDADHHRWMYSMRGSAITEHIVEEPIDAVRTARIAGRLGESRTDGIQPAGRPALRAQTDQGPKRIATTRYVEAGAETDHHAWITRQIGTATWEDVKVPLLPGKQHYDVGYDSEVSALMLSMTRIFPNWPDTLYELIANHYKRVNGITFKGADVGHVKFDDFAVDEVSMVIGDGSLQGEQGIAHRVSLGFLWSSQAWTPLDMVVMFPDETGATNPVLNNADGTKVVESFEVIAYRDFDGMIRGIEQGSYRGP